MRASEFHGRKLYVVAGFVKGVDNRRYAWRKVGGRRKWFEVDFSDHGEVHGISDRFVGPNRPLPAVDVMLYGEELKKLIRHIGEDRESSLSRVA